MMRKYLLAVLSALFLTGALASAQDILRYNYKKNGYIYTGTERIRVVGTGNTTPLHLKLSRVSFPDGAAVYILRVDVESSAAWKMPKNATLTIRTTNGKTVLARHTSDEPNLVAPQGIRNANGTKTWWNYGEYYLELADIQKIAVGVASIDLQYRMSTDGVIKVTYRNDEFGKAIFQQFEAIEGAPAPKTEIGSQLAAVNDQGGNRMVDTKTLSVNAQLSMSMGYVYYASGNSEEYELHLFLPGKQVPLDGAVDVVTSAGSVIHLKQEKGHEAGEITCYPDAAQLRRMAKGVSRVSFQTTSGTTTLNFADGAFAQNIDKLYNALQTAAIL